MAFKRSRVRSPSAPPFLLMKSYFIYILKSGKNGSSYVGHTADLQKRLLEHNNGKSLSTRNKRPWKLIYTEEFQTRSEAMLREKYFKSIEGRRELKASKVLE